MTCTRLALAYLSLCTNLNVLSCEIKLKGDDFVAYNISGEISWPLTRHSLWFDFKTVEPNGLLVYIGSEMEHQDFVMIDLVHGKLRYVVFLIILQEVNSN